MRKLQAFLPRQSLVTVYKAFIRLYLDYGDIIYNQTYNDSLHQKMRSIQYNATIAITGTIRSTSREKLYQEVGLQLLRKKRWCRKLWYFFKIYKGQSSEHFVRILPNASKAYDTRANNIVPLFNGKHNFF